MYIYIVRQGDSVDSVAEANGADADSLIQINQLTYPYRLAVGQSLLIPDAGMPETGSGEGNNSPADNIASETDGNYRASDNDLSESGNRYIEQYNRDVRINGYAYPFINQWTLGQTLPYLTTLSVFSYGFTMEGYLISPQLPDIWMIQESLNRGTAPILTLTPFGPDGNFNNNLIHSVVTNNQYASRLISQVLDTVRNKGFAGVDIDFEYILAQDRDLFTQFVSDMTETMNVNGYTVSVALAPKTSADQRGLLYEGKDYRALGQAANSVLLMTYEWGYTYGPPMAVAPINMVRRVIEYALTEIPAEKIDMGIPNYGYDWILPYRRGETRATTIGNVQAVQIAIDNNAAIQFDETAQTPFFRYISEGLEHEVWFEDARSINAKLNLIQEYNIRGAGYWQIMQWFKVNWEILSYKYEINKSF